MFHTTEELLPPAGFESTPFWNFPLQAGGLQAHATTPGKTLSPDEYFTAPIESNQVTREWLDQTQGFLFCL